MEERVERTWRVKALMAFPTEIPLAPDGGLPARLEPQSRVPSQTHTVAGVRLALRPATEDEEKSRESHPNWSWGAMTVEVAAPDSGLPHERAVDAMETAVAVMDRLAELCQVLRAVVNAALKAAMRIAADAPPIVAHGQLTIWPHTGLGGTRHIDENDLSWPDTPGP